MKLHLNQGKTQNVEILRGVRQGYSISAILFNLYEEVLMLEALAEIEDFKMGGGDQYDEKCGCCC